MEEEQGFRKSLDQVPEEVSAAHVGQFVGQNHFQLVRPKRRGCRDREHHKRFQCADGHWTGKRARDAQKNWLMDTEGSLDAVEAGTYGRGCLNLRGGAQALNQPPASEAPKRERENAEEPERDKRTKRGERKSGKREIGLTRRHCRSCGPEIRSLRCCRCGRRRWRDSVRGNKLCNRRRGRPCVQLIGKRPHRAAKREQECAERRQIPSIAGSTCHQRAYASIENGDGS